MSSRNDNFERSSSRSWDIIAAAMGGAVALGVGFGVQRYLKDVNHKTDLSNVGPGKSPEGVSGGRTTTNKEPSWSQHSTFTRPKPSMGRSRGLRLLEDNANIFEKGTYESIKVTPLDIRTKQLTKNVKRNFFLKEGAQVSQSLSISLGGKPIGNIPDILSGGSVYDYAKQIGNPDKILGSNPLSPRGIVAKAGGLDVVIPGFVSPDVSVKGKLAYKKVDPLTLFKQTLEQLNRVEAGGGSSSQRAFMKGIKGKGGDVITIGKQLTGMYNSLARKQNFSLNLMQQDLTEVFNLSEGSKKHGDLLGFMHSSGLFGTTAENAHLFNAFGAEKVLKTGADGSFHYANAVLGGFTGSAGSSVNIANVLLEADSSVALQNIGVNRGTSKAEQLSAGFLTTSPTGSIAGHFMAAPGQRMNEGIHARPMAPGMKSRALEARNQGLGVFSGGVIDSVQRSSMRKSHSRSLVDINVGNGRSPHISTTLATTFIYDTVESGTGVLSEGSMYVGLRKNEVSKEAFRAGRESTKFIDPKTMRIKMPGSRDHILGLISPTKKKSFRSKILKDIKKTLGKDAHAQAVALHQSDLIKIFADGGFKGVSIPMKGNELFGIPLESVDDQALLQLKKEYRLTGIDSAPEGIQLNTFREGNLADPGRAASLAQGAHVSVVDGVPQVMRNNLKGLKIMAAAHINDMKGIYAFRTNVSQFLATPMLIGDSSAADVVKQRVRQLESIFSEVGLKATTGTSSSDLPSFNLTVDERKIAGMSGTSTKKYYEAMRKIQSDYLGADNYKQRPIIVGDELEKGHLFKMKDGRWQTGALATEVEVKIQDNSELFKYGKAGTIGGGSSSKFTTKMLTSAKYYDQPNLEKYIKDVLHKGAKGTDWVGAWSLSKVESESSLKSRGGLLKIIGDRLGNTKVGGKTRSRVGNLQDLLRDGGGDISAINKALEGIDIDAGEVPESMQKLFTADRGYVINITEGLSEDAADNLRVMSQGDGFVIPRKEVVLFPFGGVQTAGSSDLRIKLGTVNKTQLAFIADVSRVQQGVKLGTMTVERGNQILNKSHNTMEISHLDAFGGKGGLLDEMKSGVRADLSGYQQILSYDDLIDTTNKYRLATDSGNDFATGFYTKNSAGKYEAIDKRFLEVSPLRSINDIEEVAAKELRKNNISETVYAFTEGLDKAPTKVGIAGFGASVGYPDKDPGLLMATRAIFTTQEGEHRLGLNLATVTAYGDKVSRYLLDRDTDFDAWSRFMLGDQESLKEIHGVNKSNWQYFHDIRSASLKASSVGGGIINPHDMYGDFPELAIDSITASTTQKRATGMLDIALDSRAAFYEDLLGNEETFSAIMEGTSKENASYIDKHLSKKFHKEALLGSLLSTERQITINKGFGSQLMYLATAELTEGGSKTSAGRVQKLLAAAMMEMSYAPVDAEMAEVKSRYANLLSNELSTFAKEKTSIDNVEFHNYLKSSGNYDQLISNLDTMIGSVTDPQKGVASMEKMLGKINVALPKIQQSIIDEASADLDPQVRAANRTRAATAFSDIVGRLNDATASVVATTDQNSNVDSLLRSVKQGGGSSKKMADIVSALGNPNSPKGGHEEVLNQFGFNLIEDPIITESSPQGPSQQRLNIDETLANKNKATAAAKPKKGLYESSVDMLKVALKGNTDINAADFLKKQSAFLDGIQDTFVTGNKKYWWGGAAALATVVAGAHVIGALNSPSASGTIEDAPLPANTVMDDGVIMTPPEFNAAPGPPSVRVASEQPRLNSTDITYNGSDLSSVVEDTFRYSGGGGAFVHNDRRSFDRGSMMRYKEDQEVSRF